MFEIFSKKCKRRNDHFDQPQKNIRTIKKLLFEIQKINFLSIPLTSKHLGHCQSPFKVWIKWTAVLSQCTSVQILHAPV